MELNKCSKPIFCFLLCVFSFQLTKAQTFAEWFSQKKTRIKYLTQQIAALEQYGSYVKQGYAISQNGLGAIGNWVKSEYGLHATYYSSLKTVNPEIRSNPKADSIITFAEQIPERFDHLNSLNGLDADNRNYISAVKAKVLDECDKDLSELQLIITSGQAQLRDDERLQRIDAIYSRVKDKYAFTLSFCNQIRMPLLQRDQELRDIQTLNQIYGLH